MTSKKPPVVTLTVSSLKGNTLGILERLDGSMFNYAIQIKRQPVEELQELWDMSDIILLGTSTYSSKFRTEVEFPAQLRRYQSVIEGLTGKQIILFGSGRSEYPLFCGALDYLEDKLQHNNEILMKYKFEGYPREREKEEFKNRVEGIINGIVKV